jgi:hypothetical protein
VQAAGVTMAEPMPIAPTPPPMLTEPAQAGSVRSLLFLGRILAIVIALVGLLYGVSGLYFAFAHGYGLLAGLYGLLAFVICLLLFVRLGDIGRRVEARLYAEAKESLLIWAVLGILFGYVIAGIVPLVVWLMLDPLINWQRAASTSPAVPPWVGPGPPAWQPPPSSAPPSVSPPVVPPPAIAPPAPSCARCGRPTVWIAQYGRWYCYTDQLYA